tara:strand:- start:13118 stop:14143 length:1026 start_codon:yes stop_codon:yes gene_type:complete
MIIFFLLLAVFNLIIIIKLDKLAKLINIYDKPDRKLKFHKNKTPILGGLIFFVNFIFLLIYQIFSLDKFLFLETNIYKMRDIIGILLLILSFFILGIYDDKYNLTPLKKIFYTLIFVLISISLNKTLQISDFSMSFYDHKIFLDHFSLIFTLFCFLILTNSLNFYDGINGQSCTFFIIIFSYLFLKSDMNEFYMFIILFLLILLFLNLRNRIFLGDGGIFLIASIASISLIYEYNYMNNIRFADEIFFLLLLPGFDLIRLTFLRIINGKNAFMGDRNHIHHLLNNRLSLTYTNVILIFISILPIITFLYFGQNFLITLTIFVVLYFFLIFTFKLNNKKKFH